MDSLRYFAIRQLKVPALVHLALRNKAVEGFFRASPAVRPALFLYQLWTTVEEHGPKGDHHWNLVICDLPTSGFVAGMYAIPNMLSGVFRTGPIATYAEGMLALKTLELRALLLERHGVEAAAVVLNAVMPRSHDADVLDALDRAADRDPGLLDAWQTTAERIANRRAKALSAARRLRDTLPPNTLITLPWRFERELNLQAIDDLALAMRKGVA